MSKKLTSVEWLEDMIKNMVYNGADFGDDYPSLLVHIKKAKQMEKEQIIDTYEAGEENAMDCHSIPNFNDITAEQYYNETFKQQEK
jgi:hypothetical protein